MAPAPSWAARTLESGLAAFAATTGALLVFAHSRGATLAPFAKVGRRVARDIVLPAWGDAVVGMFVHLGHSLALGGIAALLIGASRSFTRLRAALVVVLAWQLAAKIPWLAVIRVDEAMGLSPVQRVGVAALLTAAIALGTRSERRTAN